MIYANPSVRMNKMVRNSLRARLHTLLDQGNFPEVEWIKGPVYHYNTREYLLVWGRMAALVDDALKDRGFALGCYEMRRSDQFRSCVVEAINRMTPQDILTCAHMRGVPEMA